MRSIRKEDLSLYYYIKHVALADFIEIEEGIQLEKMKKLSMPDSNVYEAKTNMDPSPTGNGRGWVYFDEGVSLTDPVPEQSNRITVYDDEGVVIPDTDYMIDYIDGRVIVPDTINPSTIDYAWNYVSVLDEWPSKVAPGTPIVVIDLSQTNKEGYQLGAGEKVKRGVEIDVFASNTAERNDIVDVLFSALYNKSCLFYEFENGTALDFDGTFFGRKENPNKLTSLFSRATVNGVSNLQFENVSSRNIKLPLFSGRRSSDDSLSDLNSYRSKINFTMTSYTNL